MKPLHHKKNTLAKRGLSLLCVLALCLGLLPVTALAAEEDVPNVLYVGNRNFASTIYPDNAAYWTSSDGGTNWTSQLEKPTGDSYIHYNGQGTLTLHNANIQGQYDSSNRYSGYGIYAVGAPGNAVSLTIKLEGTNTVSGWSGIFVHAVDGAASLSISGTGSLATEGTGGISFSGIVVQGNGGKAELTINNVDVTATNTSDSAQGILLQSADSSPATLTVNGGELTASGQRAGIKYVFGSSGTGGGTPTVTVSGNAIVRANGGISDDSSTDIQIGADSNESNGGIVFDGKNGTVYGAVTLQEDITIGEGESLTIGQDANLTVRSGTTLTNNGTVTTTEGGTLTNSGTINNSGTLTGNITNAPPKITTTSLLDGTVNAAYNQTLAADNNPTSWSVTSGSLPAGLTMNASTGEISGTPTNADAYTFTVKAENNAGSDSKAFILTVTQPVTSVTLDKNTLELYTGGSENLTATVAPDNATNKTVTWSSSDNTVATVDTNGKVTAVKEGTAAITATAADDSNISATCTVTVTDKTYTISADPTALNFGSAYTGYTQPAAQTVTLTNTGNQRVTLTQPASTNSFEVGTLSKMELAVGETAIFTIQPKENLPRGSYSEQITITGDNNVSETLTATFTVKEPPYTGKYSYEIATDIGDNGAISVDRYATEGDEVTITVTPDEAYKLDDLSVTAGGKDVELTANSDGTYSFTMPSADVRITATFAEDPDWTPDEPEEPTTDVSDLFSDIAPDAWYKDAIQYAYDNGLMTGVSANEFAPEATTTRAMIVSMLARLEGVESANNAGFADVSNEWYATAVNWAANVGVVNGYEDGTFKPNTAITREQLAAILMNYAQYKGQDVSARADLNGYTDQPSTWAEEAISWSVAEGLLTGVTADTLQPQGAATRAQVAAILQRFLSE